MQQLIQPDTLVR